MRKNTECTARNTPLHSPRGVAQLFLLFVFLFNITENIGHVFSYFSSELQVPRNVYSEIEIVNATPPSLFIKQLLGLCNSPFGADSQGVQILRLWYNWWEVFEIFQSLCYLMPEFEVPSESKGIVVSFCTCQCALWRTGRFPTLTRHL